MEKPVVVSGLKPSGRIHIGNYLGMIKQSIALQESGEYRCYYFIADYHALTQKYVPAEKKQEIIDAVFDLLALGVDPEKSVFFIQSDVTAHANLTWLLNTVTPAGQLQNMIEFKEKVEAGHPANAGLLNYPILMAADILSYKAAFVPVGEDQRQHLELTRDVARNFNREFGETFPEPKGIYVEGLRIKSLDDPSKKMSKSLPKGCVYLSDSPEEIMRKIKAAVTDSGSNIEWNPEEKPALSNLLLIYSSVSGISIEEIVESHKDSNYSAFKEALSEVVADSLFSFREKRKEVSSDLASLRSLMLSGAEKASKVADATLSEVKKKMGMF